MWETGVFVSRNNNQSSRPQRYRHVVHHEAVTALNAEIPKGFGVRRLLAQESQDFLLDQFRLAVDDNIIPETFKPWNSLQVVFVPKDKVVRQLKKGIVAKCVLGEAMAKINANHPERVKAKLGKVDIIKNSLIGMNVSGVEVQKDYEATIKMFDELGLKGVYREQPQLRVNLGRIATKWMPRTEKREMLDVLNDFMPVGGVIELQAMKPYTGSGGYVADTPVEM